MNKLSNIIAYCKGNNISVFRYARISVTYKRELKKEQIRAKKRHSQIDLSNRKNLINDTPSIVSINCNGCTIAHDLGLRFNSQFVNLWMYPKDFLKYLQDFDYYNSLPLSFVQEDGIDYPIGEIDGMRIYFMHYSSEEEARSKWIERRSRIDKNNLFVMMTDQENCSMEQMKEFDALPYRNKVIFTHIPQPGIESSFYIHGFENAQSVGKLNGYIDEKSLYKWYDQFDYVEWFNTGTRRYKE